MKFCSKCRRNWEPYTPFWEVLELGMGLYLAQIGPRRIPANIYSSIRAVARENLSSAIEIRLYQNQPALLQRLARKVKFHLELVLI